MKHHKLFMLIFSLGILTAGLLYGHIVHAQEVTSTGRDYAKTFFLDQWYTGPSSSGSVYEWPSFKNVSTIDQFVKVVKERLFDPTGNGRIWKQADTLGSAAFTVDHMLGKKGPDFGGDWNAGVQYAKDNFATWESTVRYYDSQGWVNYNDSFVQCPPFDHYNLDYVYHDAFTYRVKVGEGSCHAELAITFSSPSGGYFRIMKDCGNPSGIHTALTTTPPPPPASPPTGTLNPPTPGDPTTTPPTPPAYNAGSPASYSSCQLITGTAHDPADPTYAVPVTITFTGPSGPLGSVNTTSATSGIYDFSVSTPAYVRTSITSITVTATGKAKNGTTFAIGSPLTPFGPCITANTSCGAMTTNPTAIDPNTSFTVTTSVRYGSLLEAQTAQSQPGFRYFIKITGPGGYNFTDNNVTPLALDPATYSFTGSVSQPGLTNSGTYQVGWGIAGPFGAVNCGTAIPGNTTPTFSVVNIPYFQVLGGDVSAGAGMSLGGTSCALGADTNASVVGWNRGAGSGYSGSGTRYGVLALNHLQDFASAQGSGVEPTGLTFANDNSSPSGWVDVSGGLFGGKFSAEPCESDFFVNAGSSPPTGDQKLSTLLGIAPGSTYNVPDGSRKAWYIDGKVLIDVNVKFDGDYANPEDIPAFSVIVKGNMYIAPSVDRIDGFYIAEPSGAAATDGIIYSCAPSGFSTTSANVLNQTLQSNCSQALTINGAVAARQLWLLRTAGTLSTPVAAETINYLPEMWMSAPYGNGLSPANVEIYDSLTNPAPVL